MTTPKTPAQIQRELEMEVGRKRVEHYTGERILRAPPPEEPAEVTEPGKRKTKAELKAEAIAAAAAAAVAAAAADVDDEPL